MSRSAKLWLFVGVSVVAPTTAFVVSRALNRGETAVVRAGLEYRDSLDRSTTVRPEDAEALAALYLERTRLGVGSPFRLIDQALHDPMVDRARGRQIGYAILGLTAEGMAYSTPSDALDMVSSVGRGLGLAHRNLMEATLDSAVDVRAAESALRLAYQVSAVSGSVSPRAASVAVLAIAQARDRTLARRDALDLIEYARRRRLDPIDLVSSWRAGRRFRVERPLVDPNTAQQDRLATGMLPSLMERIDSTSARAPRTRREQPVAASLVVAAAAAVARRDAPPQAPVVVTLNGFSGFLLGNRAATSQRAARAAFLAQSRTEEALVAEYTRLRLTDSLTSDVSLGALAAAVALRAYAQESPWFPGDYGPAGEALRDQLGLGAVEFDATVPRRWQPYYTRMFAASVQDLRRVLPKVDLQGLRVRFGDSPMRERSLALHDPRSRTVYLPIATSAGAIAHELSHDLDWQAARERYGTMNGYRTDRSVRLGRDGLGATVARMAASASGTRRSLRPAALGGERPTEAFARGVDWIVAAFLASEGISNGYLSAVQDTWITGYASATVPRQDVAERDPTMSTLQEIADVSPKAIAWFDHGVGSSRRMSVADAVRRTLSAPFPRVDLRGTTTAFPLEPWTASLRVVRATAGGGWACQLNTPGREGSDVVVLRSAMTLAAETRVRGIVRRWQEYADEGGGGWRLKSLGGPPWLPGTADSVVQELRDALLWRAARVDDGRLGSDFAERAERDAARTACSRSVN